MLSTITDTLHQGGSANYGGISLIFLGILSTGYNIYHTLLRLISKPEFTETHLLGALTLLFASLLYILLGLFTATHLRKTYFGIGELRPVPGTMLIYLILLTIITEYLYHGLTTL